MGFSMDDAIHLPEAVVAMRALHERLDRNATQLLAGWDAEPPPTVALFDVFAEATVELLGESDPNLQPLFDLIELLLRRGDAQVVECVTTGFVESLSNSAHELDPQLWRGRLGPRALAHAQAWAAFWGASE
jgi:hypothetical protein